MSKIIVDLQAETITVDDYIHLHSSVDFIVRNVEDHDFALTISTHQGIILFRISNFTDNGTELSYRTDLESDGLIKAFRHVPKSGCRRFLLNAHDKNASFSVRFSGEIMIWNDIASSTDMSAYALKSEIPDVSRFVTADYLFAYALKTDLPDLSVYARKTELFSGSYSDLNGTPDLSVYALKTELPDLSGYALKTDIPDEVDLSNYLTITVAASTFAVKNHTHSLSDISNVSNLSESYAAIEHTHSQYALKTEIPSLPDLSIYALKTELPDLSVYALKTELFSGKYSDLNGTPDLSIYALKTDIPDEVDLSAYALKSELFSKNYSDLNGIPDLSVYALKTDIPGEVDLSNYLTISVAAATYAVKNHTHTLSDISNVSDLSESYAVVGHTHPEYALKTEIPDLSGYALKTELFSGNYSDLNGTPDLSVYALKTDIPDEVDLSAYALKSELFSKNYSDLNGTPDLSIYALKNETGSQGAAAISFARLAAITDETTYTGTAQLVNADGTAGETVDIVYDFDAPTETTEE